MSDDNVIGLVFIARHGDRQGFYQDPESYTASATSITPLGEQQEFQLGAMIRQLYLNSSSPTYINGVSPADALFNQVQVAVRADAGGEGGVIFDSSVALLQGLWPPTSLANTTLANGTTITSPLGGYQYIPIESVEPNEDVSLEGFTACNTFTKRNQDFYNSPGFLQVANQSQPFLSMLPPYMDGRPVTLENMWNIFDYMNVQSIHNATFARDLPPTFLAQARALANYHEYGVFTDPTFGGIGDIAGTAMLPSLLTAFQRIANASDPLKLHYTAIAYKPFLSLFNMTGVVGNGQLPAGIVNYASAVAMEVRQPASGGEPVIRFKFKNGTDDDVFNTYNMSFPGWENVGGDAPLSSFISAFQPVAINTTLQWCHVCNQTQARGCAALLAAPAQTMYVGSHDKISPVGAGFLGAGLALFVAGCLVAATLLGGVISWRKKGSSQAGYPGGLKKAPSSQGSV